MQPPPDLPPPLMLDQPGSFAWYTMSERWPAIARRVVQENPLAPQAQTSVLALAQEFPDTPLTPIPEDGGPDMARWQEDLLPYLGRPWRSVPCFFAEVYFYRRLLAATGYFQSGIDPFKRQKLENLESQRASPTPPVGDARQQVLELLYGQLWGNQADLSLRPTEAADAPTEDQTGVDRLLVDQAPELASRLLGLRGGRVDCIADNAGSELLADLYLLDYLLDRDLATTVHLHLKSHPTFVSDATVEDLHDVLVFLFDSGSAARCLAERLRGYLDGGRLQLGEASFWTEPRVFWEMPEALRSDLAGSDLVLIKGDANYRRLLGDRRWDYSADFGRITAYFPAPFVALRTLKSEVAAGLPAGRVAGLDQQEHDWATSGRWGVIQGLFH